jgi:hypothetical protein
MTAFTGKRENSGSRKWASEQRYMNLVYQNGDMHTKEAGLCGHYWHGDRGVVDAGTLKRWLEPKFREGLDPVV